MIPNFWYAILESSSVPADRPVGTIRMGLPLVLWRDSQGKIVCMQDRCAHRGVALSIGRVTGGQIACRYHGFQYDREGQCTFMPCAGKGARIPGGLTVPTYPVREENGFIWLWWGKPRAEYPPVPWLDEVPRDPKELICHAEVWPFNYVRIIENHLDVHHWAFVHNNIMLGVGEHFEDFQMEVKEDFVATWGSLRPRSQRWGKGRPWYFRTALRLPNVNLIQVTKRFRSLIIQTPIDADNTWVVICSYQTYTRLPLLRFLVDNYCMNFLLKVPLHHQDFPIFHAQDRHTGVGINKLVKADSAIAHYLNTREKLLRQARQEAAGDERPEGATEAPLPGLAGDSAELQQLTVRGVQSRSRTAALLPMSSSLHEQPASPFRLKSARRRSVDWLVACMTFPLLVPSVLAAWVRRRVVGHVPPGNG